MSSIAERPLTFEEFVGLGTSRRLELAHGQLEELVSPRPLRGWAAGRLSARLDGYLSLSQPDAFWAPEVDVPTVPGCGRRPDFAYYTPADAAARLDLAANRVLGPPTRVVEVVSEDEEERDRVTKRREYAAAGIPHYSVAADLGSADTLSSPLFPELAIPVRALFR